AFDVVPRAIAAARIQEKARHLGIRLTWIGIGIDRQEQIEPAIAIEVCRDDGFSPPAASIERRPIRSRARIEVPSAVTVLQMLIENPGLRSLADFTQRR